MSLKLIAGKIKSTVKRYDLTTVDKMPPTIRWFRHIMVNTAITNNPL